MGLSISLRTNKNISHFRRNLLNLIRAPESNRLLICSGYISIPIGYRRGYSILDDQLLYEIKSHCEEVTTIGAMLNWPPQVRIKYEKFIKTLIRAGIKLFAFEAINKRCHREYAIYDWNDNQAD